VKNHGKRCFFDGDADVLSGYDSDLTSCWKGQNIVGKKCELIQEPEDETLKYREAVEKANREGEKLQWTYLKKEKWIDRFDDKQGEPLFWDDHNYRIKPNQEPKIIPWTAETCPFPLAIRQKSWPKGVFIVAIFTNEEGVLVIDAACNDIQVSFGDLSDPEQGWEQRNGQPCGEVVDGI